MIKLKAQPWTYFYNENMSFFCGTLTDENRTCMSLAHFMKSHKKGIISLFYCGECLDKDQDLNPKNVCIKCAVK